MTDTVKIESDVFDLLGRYPELFSECELYSPRDGWLKCLGPLFERLAKDPNCRVLEVKRKNGGLRVYLTNYTESQRVMIRKAERECDKSGKESA